ncbi:hypothetical protein [Helicobacter apodemus]|nr:hypothetical protein [Helicobacter apodemus]
MTIIASKVENPHKSSAPTTWLLGSDAIICKDLVKIEVGGGK